MYRVLYRKWRPRTFDEVSGQPHITETLKNELKSGRIAHAYLFTGSRGTGKTSCAKILSKAVNCLSPVDGNPCNECDICRGIDDGSILDVTEIDAASNNGVDNIRDLRDEANFTPVRAKYRVYIIDEVHMLSSGAFNALLKILEEPPEHVIFILATTEVHKIFATILSRCQRFDFRRIASEDIAARISFVAGEEGLDLEPEAASLIAKLADGALRDALSLLDRCCAGNSHIDAETVTKSAGLAGRDYLFKLSLCVKNRDCSSALQTLNELYENSCDMEQLCAEYILHLRDLLIVKTVKSAGDILICTAEELKQLGDIAAQFGLEELLYCLSVMEASLAAIKRSSNKRVEMEMSFIRLCSEQLDTSKDALLRRIAALEERLGSGSPPEINDKVTNNTAPPASEKAPAPLEKEPSPPPREEAPPAPENPAPAPSEPENADSQAKPFELWAEVIEELKETDMPLVGILNGAAAYIKGNFLLIKSDNPALKMFLCKDSHASLLAKAVLKKSSKQYKIGLYKTAEPQSAQKDPLDGLMKKIDDFKNN